jgi:hypothetical protein
MLFKEVIADYCENRAKRLFDMLHRFCVVNRVVCIVTITVKDLMTHLVSEITASNARKVTRSNEWEKKWKVANIRRRAKLIEHFATKTHGGVEV